MTKASTEIQYLVVPISSLGIQGGSASSRLLFKALREVPAFVIEHQGTRKLLSTAGLEAAGEFVSFDSTMVRRMESLLVELPEAITLSDIAHLSGGQQDPDWETPHPRLCGTSRGVFAHLLRREWEPKEIKVNSAGLLAAHWVRKPQEESNQSRWSLAPLRTSSGVSEIVQYIDVYAQRLAELGGRHLRDAIYVPRENISIVGMDDFDAAMVNRSIYILPHSPVMQLRLSESLSETERLLIISAITKLLASQRMRRIYRSRRLSPSRTVDEMLDSILRMDIESIMSENEFKKILFYDFRFFDISQWDREFLETD